MTAAFFGFFLVVVDVSCVAFGLLTGAMPPFPSKVASYISYRDEDPVSYWMNGGFYAAMALYGCYLIVTNWGALLQALGA
jgi:hypothetical protein